MISVVLFDLDDTLFDHRRSVELGITAHRITLGGDVASADAAVEFTRWNALEEHHYHRYLSGELDFLGQRRERARGFVAPYGLELDDDAADDWFATYLLEYEKTWSLHADVAPCLEALAPRRFGVVTNGDLEFQQSKLRATGLLDRVEYVIASGSLGVAKPDPAIFRHACEVFGVSPDEACYVGDRLRTDAVGAAEAGLLGVWLDRPGRATPDELAEAAAAGVPVIRTLAELPGLLS
jgi:putative hydrolase of the HAD superfamily